MVDKLYKIKIIIYCLFKSNKFHKNKVIYLQEMNSNLDNLIFNSLKGFDIIFKSILNINIGP